MVNRRSASPQPNTSKDEKRAIILTALPVEYKAVQAHLEGLERHVDQNGAEFEHGFFESQWISWKVAIAQSGVGSIRAAVLTQKAILHFYPDIVMFVGVAGGLKDVSIGDVVAATKVYGYEFARAEESLRPRPVVHSSSFALEQCARAEVVRGRWLRWASPGPKQLAPGAFVAPIAAGSKVVASTDSATYTFIREEFSDALAVEMEALGVLDAAYSCSLGGTIAICGISDLITGKEAADASGFQEIASRNASAFAFSMLEQLRPTRGIPIYPAIELGPASGSALTSEEAKRIHAVYRAAAGVMESAIAAAARELASLDASAQSGRVLSGYRRWATRKRKIRESSYREALGEIVYQAIGPRFRSEMTPREILDALERAGVERRTLTSRHIRRIYVSTAGVLKLAELQECFERAGLGAYVGDRLEGLERGRHMWELRNQ